MLPLGSRSESQGQKRIEGFGFLFTLQLKHRSDTWIFASVSMAVAPTEGDVEFLDFCGALLSLRQTKDRGRLGLLSKGGDADEWTWYELDRDLGSAVEGHDGMRSFELKFAINRKDRSWSLGVDDLAFYTSLFWRTCRWSPSISPEPIGSSFSIAVG